MATPFACASSRSTADKIRRRHFVSRPRRSISPRRRPRSCSTARSSASFHPGPRRARRHVPCGRSDLFERDAGRIPASARPHRAGAIHRQRRPGGPVSGRPDSCPSSSAGWTEPGAGSDTALVASRAHVRGQHDRSANMNGNCCSGLFLAPGDVPGEVPLRLRHQTCSGPLPCR